jgi:hypothetical protein
LPSPLTYGQAHYRRSDWPTTRDRAHQDGISGQEINEITASLNDLPTGIYIRSIEAGFRAGRHRRYGGRHLTKIDGTEIASFDDVSDILSPKTRRSGGTHPLPPYTIRQAEEVKLYRKITLVEDGSDQAP